MSYYSTIRKGKAAALQAAMDDAKASMVQDIQSDQAYRELLINYIESMNTEIREYDKMLANLNIAEGDPAQLRRSVTRTYESGAGKGKDQIDILTTIGTLSDKKMDGFAKHDIELRKQFAPYRGATSSQKLMGKLDQAYDFYREAIIGPGGGKAAIFEMLDHAGIDDEATLVADMSATVESAMGGADNLRKTLESSFGKLGLPVSLINEYLSNTNLGGLHPSDPWKSDADFENYKSTTVRASPKDTADIDYSIDALQKIIEDPDSKIPLVNRGTSTRKTTEDVLTDEALEIRAKRDSIEFKALREALFNDGEISEIEEEAWRKVRAEGDTRTLGDLRLEFLDDVQLENLERRGKLTSERDRLISERDATRAAQKEMGAPVRYDQDEINRRAAESYSPSATAQIPLGLSDRLPSSDRKALRAMDAARRGMVSTDPAHKLAADQVSKTASGQNTVSEVERLSQGVPEDQREAYQEGVLSIIMGGILEKLNTSKLALGKTNVDTSPRSASEPADAPGPDSY